MLEDTGWDNQLFFFLSTDGRYEIGFIYFRKWKKQEFMIREQRETEKGE